MHRMPIFDHVYIVVFTKYIVRLLVRVVFLCATFHDERSNDHFPPILSVELLQKVS